MAGPGVLAEGSQTVREPIATGAGPGTAFYGDSIYGHYGACGRSLLVRPGESERAGGYDAPYRISAPGTQAFGNARCPVVIEQGAALTAVPLGFWMPEAVFAVSAG